MPHALQREIEEPDFLDLLAEFLSEQILQSGQLHSSLPGIQGKISVYPSPVAMFYALCDISGIGGMRRKRIWAVPLWRKGPARYDCVFVNTDADADGMLGLDIARVRMFFSFQAGGRTYPCALVQWYSCVSEQPDEETGMWIAEPDVYHDGSPVRAVIHLDSIVRAHLIRTYSKSFIPKQITCKNSLDSFHTYYVNKFADHHAFAIAY